MGVSFNVRLLAFAVQAAVLASCAANGNATNPPVTQGNLHDDRLQLAVGTARIGQDGAVGLNVVATLRSPSGRSGPLANMPALTGPPGFLVPAGAPGAYSGSVAGVGANVDAGTNHISGSPQVPLNNTGLVNSTLGTFTGVFSYGFAPVNSDQTVTSGAYYIGNPNASGGNGFATSIYDGSSVNFAACAALGTCAGDATQPVPIFSADPFDYVIGPPAVPFFGDGTYPPGFAGYSSGFTVFEVPPVAGAYALNVAVTPLNAPAVTYSASAGLSNATPLGAMGAPSLAGSGGGATISVAVPAGVTETLVYVYDASTNQYYTAGPQGGTGTLSFSLPGTLGPCTGSNCQGTNPSPTLNPGDRYIVAAVGFDYPAFEAAPPGNAQQTPAIAGSTGQADLTMSPLVVGSY